MHTVDCQEGMVAHSTVGLQEGIRGPIQYTCKKETVIAAVHLASETRRSAPYRLR